MAERYCPRCGTEVEADARFCPTCGSTLGEEEPELPPAPNWPDVEPAEGAEPDAAATPDADPRSAEPIPELASDEQLTLEPKGSAAGVSEATPMGEPPMGEPPSASEPDAAEPRLPAAGELPWSWPTTLSGWLIGGGALVGALALIPSLANPVSLLLFLALLGVAASIFLPERLPEIPRLRLLVLSVSMVGLGVGLERAGFRASGVDSLLLVAMIAAAGGTLLVELDRDRPVPPASR